MFARTLAVLCAVPMSILLPARAVATDGQMNIAQAKTISPGTTQEGESAAPSAKPQQTLPNREAAFELSGVIVGPDLKQAILKHLSTNKKRTVRVGDEIDGWTVQEIASDHVLLRHEGEHIRVELSTKRGVVNSGAVSNTNRSTRPAQPPPAIPRSSYSRAATAPTSLTRQQQRAAQRAQLAAERNARRIQRQQRLTACRLQAQQQRLKRESRRAFINACSGR